MSSVTLFSRMVYDTFSFAILETGQAMQRLGLRVAGNQVIKQDRFRSIGAKRPQLDNCVQVKPSTTIIGNVFLHAHCSAGANTVFRGELNEIHVGMNSHFGDNCVISAGHDSVNGMPANVEIGSKVNVGSNCVIESCFIHNMAKIGDNCVISEGSVVEAHAVLEPGSVVPPLSRVPANEIWGGNPIKFVGKVGDH